MLLGAVASSRAEEKVLRGAGTAARFHLEETPAAQRWGTLSSIRMTTDIRILSGSCRGTSVLLESCEVKE